jgi:uncharacterized protein (TIGR00730 family)
MIHSVTVFCSARTAIPKVYFTATAELGAAIAREGWSLVYGGNSVGLMETIAQSARDAGGKVIGITPQLMYDHGLSDSKADELIITANMRDRKAMLEQRGDAFIALPGGLGTLEEISEIIVGRQLGYHNKPIVLLNIADYYRPMLEMIEHGIEQKFIMPRAWDLFFVATTVEQAIAHLRQPVVPEKAARTISG